MKSPFTFFFLLLFSPRFEMADADSAWLCNIQERRLNNYNLRIIRNLEELGIFILNNDYYPNYLSVSTQQNINL